MERLPLNKLNKIILLQREYNVFMGKLQEELKKNFEQFNEFLKMKENYENSNT